MRGVTRHSVIFFPSSCISKSATRAHLKPRTVLAASAMAFSAALAKLSLEAPTMLVAFCAIFASLKGLRSIPANLGPEWNLGYDAIISKYKAVAGHRALTLGAHPICVTGRRGFRPSPARSHQSRRLHRVPFRGRCSRRLKKRDTRRPALSHSRRERGRARGRPFLLESSRLRE